jgi:putative zinc finger/helix-turn-helix YgiT family protein
MSDKRICPFCGIVSTIQRLERSVDIEVRGEKYSVNEVVHRCHSCGEEFTSSSDDIDPVDAAFSLYRERHEMLSPLEIREFRKKYELTQRELASLLGWGAVTLSRYENGALQDLAHDRELQSAMTPDGFRKLVEICPSAVEKEKRERLLQILDSSRGLRSGMLGQLEERLSSIAPGVKNGFRRFSSGRFCAAVEYFLQDCGVYKTKLNKLLFYSDFMHFNEFGVSITGCCYARLPHGPVPDDFRTLLAVMEEDAGIIETDVIDYSGTEYQGEKVLLVNSLKEYSLSSDEVKTLSTIRDAFHDFGAGEIAEYSHSFIGWIETENAHLISYEYSAQLEIPI